MQMNIRWFLKMSCFIRPRCNLGCIKKRKCIPVIIRRNYSSTKKATRGKSKKSETDVVVSSVKLQDKDVPGNEITGEDLSSTINERDVGTERDNPTVEGMSRKPTYPKISKFLIRNIMSFPIHGEIGKSDNNYQTEDSKYSSFPSVSTILGETMSAESRKFLEIWKQNMITKLGSEQFSNLQKETLVRGKKLHRAIRKYLLSKNASNDKVDEDVEGCWNSVMTALPHISNVKLVEAYVYHPHLHYKGIVDCVACFKNIPYVIEWKQAEKTKKDLSATFDAPIQLCAYMGTLPWCNNAGFTEPVTNGLVVVAYVDGSPADVFPMNTEHCQRYWEQWLRRVQRFWLIHSPELREEAW